MMYVFITKLGSVFERDVRVWFLFHLWLSDKEKEEKELKRTNFAHMLPFYRTSASVG